MIQDAYEISLLANLLRKGIFPLDKKEFQLAFGNLNSFTLDTISRRVFGLISHIDMRDRFFLEVKK